MTYIYIEMVAPFSHTFKVRGPRITGEMDLTLSVGDVITVMTEAMLGRGSFAAFEVYKG